MAIDNNINIDSAERAERAKQYFLDGYNCCQAVLLAFSDVFEAEPEHLAALGSGFGGGMGRMREVCGTVSALVMATGFISPAVNPKEMDKRTANYALVQELAGEFRKENGSIVCKELLGLVPRQSEVAPTAINPDKEQENDDPKIESPKPSERTQEYYKKRPCAELVACSAKILAEYLISK